MYGFVEHVPTVYHPTMERHGHGRPPGHGGGGIDPLTAGLIGVGLGFLGGGFLGGGPGYGPGYGPGFNPWYGPGYGPPYGPGYPPYGPGGNYYPYGYY